MMHNVVNYAWGTVTILVRGDFPERFINLCIAEHILLWEISKQEELFYVTMRLADFFRIRPLARKSRTHIEVVGFSGLPFMIKRLKRRKMLVIGGIIWLLLLNIITSYIWFVNVTGVNQLSSDRIMELACQNGLKPGILKEKVNAKQIETEILLNVPEVAWVGVSFTGTRAVIEIVEKTMPQQSGKEPADIIAAKDGILTELIVLSGQAAKKIGDTVKKGDIVIKGIVTPQAGMDSIPGQPLMLQAMPQMTKAQGIVKARVWYESYGEAAVEKIIYRRTGAREIAVSLKIGSTELPLKQVSRQPYNLFETEVIHKSLPGWRNNWLPVESTIDIYHELDASSLAISPEQARDEARARALNVVQSLIPEAAHILSRNSEVLPSSEPNLIRVKVSIETIEDIGYSVPIAQ
ncbi:MAG: sporulation protein YqfD [Veillonellales bacterium]